MPRSFKNDVPPSQITPESVWKNRRKWLGDTGRLGLGTLVAAGLSPTLSRAAIAVGKPATTIRTDEPVTEYEAATTYNNFYEFGLDKKDPARNSGDFKPDPWSIRVDGLVANPRTIAIEDLVKPADLEERIYRLRCVEAWSMVIPWIGIPLSTVVKRLEPLSGAKFVAFETILRPAEMPGQQRAFMDWPYVEGLRMDEAMNPLTILVVGMYGKPLPNQNGAPLRLVVPWKYGFKSIKSIARITFTSERPPTSWSAQAPNEYGFYANVNPNVSHPRWSQAKERRIGDLFKRDTLMFNGYGDYVAAMYAGMDLSKNF